MRIVFIGAVKFSSSILNRLLELNADIAGILTKEKSNFNADFTDLSVLAKKNDIPYKYVGDINSEENINWIKSLRPDIIFCFGFSQILNVKVINTAKMGAVGFHPAELPYNRGRHPIVWALVLGLEKTASTFFFMDRNIDSGDILSQEDVEIDYADNAQTLYDKITDTALKQVQEFFPKLNNNKFKREPQKDIKSNSWRKRDREDGKIDFRMNSRAIYNLIRGLTKPYIGAHFFYRKQEIKVWRASEVNVDLPNIEYGKVLDTANGSILVKCYDNAIIFTEHTCKELPKIGEYLL